MKFNVNQQDLQQALSYCQGVIEKRSTLPILSNVLLDASNSKLTITATDLDLIFIHQIKNIEIVEWGEVPNFDMIVNATSLGLKEEDKINLNFLSTPKNKFFYDVIYNPQETNFLKIGKNLGNKTLNGKLMFIYQALSAFNIWHEIEPVINENVIKLLDS